MGQLKPCLAQDPPGSISDPPQPGDAIESIVPADHWLAVVTTKSCDPIIIFSESLAKVYHFSVHVGRRFSYSTVER
jgi:hypothetical protein